jgi:hypothetical protein
MSNIVLAKQFSQLLKKSKNKNYHAHLPLPGEIGSLNLCVRFFFIIIAYRFSIRKKFVLEFFNN